MNDPQRRAYCCASYDDTPHERLANHFYARVEDWYLRNPLAVGCNDPKEFAKQLKRHQKQCQEAVRNEYIANQAAVDQACGFLDPISIFSIILTLIRLFYDWTHPRT